MLKRIGKAEGMEDKVETYSKKETGYSRHDHTVSIRSDENGVRLFDNACTAGSVELTVENLADKMADLTYCFFFLNSNFKPQIFQNFNGNGPKCTGNGLITPYLRLY